MVTTFKIDEDVARRMKAAIDNYDAIIGKYRKRVTDYEKGIQDAIAEIEQYNRQSYHYPCDMISIGTVLQIIRKHTKVGDDNEQTTD